MKTTTELENKILINLLSNSKIDFEQEITGIDYEEDGVHIYAYIDNKTMELWDCVISINEEKIEETTHHKILTHNWLMNEYRKNN